MARKTKLTPKIRDRIVAALEAGNYRDTACRLAGVHPGTFYRWLGRAERADELLESIEGMGKRELLQASRSVGLAPAVRTRNQDLRTAIREQVAPYRDFREAVEAALAAAESKYLAVIGSAAVGRPAIFERDPTSSLVRGADGNPVMLQPATTPDWRAAAWRLERMYPARFGNRQHVTLENITTDEIDAEIRKLEAKLAESE